MGGICVICGCVFKKLMVFVSEFFDVFVDGCVYGWDVIDGDFDWLVFCGKMYVELDWLEGIYCCLLDGLGVQVFDVCVMVKDVYIVVLFIGEEFIVKYILVVVGGCLVKLVIEGVDLVIILNEIFLFEDLFKLILIVGGGYIVSEFVGIFNGLDVKVMQMYCGEQILCGFDNECCNLIVVEMVNKGIDLQIGVNVIKFE